MLCDLLTASAQWDAPGGDAQIDMTTRAPRAQPVSRTENSPRNDGVRCVGLRRA